MHYLDRTLTAGSLTITYEKDTPGSGEKELKHLLLSVPETLELLYRTDIIQGSSEADTFADTLCVVAFVARPQGPEQDGGEEQTYRIPADQIIRDLSDGECLRMAYHHEMMCEYQKKGYRNLVNEYRQQLREIQKEIEDNRAKLAAFGEITHAVVLADAKITTP